MRIRKRPAQLPFPPCHTASSSGSPEPSDQTNHRLSLIGKWVSSAAAAGSLHDKEINIQSEEEERGEDKTRSSNDSRKGIILGAETAGTGLTLPIPSSSKPAGVCCEGERAFPLKKRRVSFDRRSSGDEETMMGKDIKTANNMKTKMNKKFVEKSNNTTDDVQDEKEAALVGTVDNKMNKKAKLKRARGNLIMEGSRCSRVNGRGWRCCQQTLVGYSLCEHHLGKGRIRNITSVKGRGLIGAAAAVAPEEENISLEEKEEKNDDLVDNAAGHEEEEEDGEHELKPLMTTNKKPKIGMVKARSLSSLLGQSDSGGVQQYMTGTEKDNELL